MGDGGMVLPASTRASTPLHNRIGKMPFTHPRVLRRHDRLIDRLLRGGGRGGTLVAVGTPLIVIALVYFVLSPRGLHINSRGPVSVSGTTGTSSRSSSSSSSKGETVPSGPGEIEHVYSIVLDAGSTGSRIHVFKFERRAGGGKDGSGGGGGELKLLSDTFEQLKPGLSSFADAPDKAAASLKPLMDAAVAAVPTALRASTAVSLKATAGLRLLPGGKADAILAAVRAFLKTYPFPLAGGDEEAAVGIMDGAHEGAYAWLTLNYLLGRLDGGPDGTVAAIDLGGGSVQEAFALTDAAADAAPEGYVSRLRAGGRAWRVYVHSYLGYGLMAARAKVIEAGGGGGGGKAGDGGGEAGDGASRGHPCFHKGASLKYSYAGKQYAVAEVAEPGDFARCARAALKALEHGRDCGRGAARRDECSFGGGWRGKPAGMARQYYVSSYLWDRAADVGIIPDGGATEWRTTPGEFAKRAAAVCGRAPAELAKSHKNLPEGGAPFLCLDLSFCHTVLTQGFDLPEAAPLTLVKQVKYNGQTIEAAWPLGAAIDALSSG